MKTFLFSNEFFLQLFELWKIYSSRIKLRILEFCALYLLRCVLSLPYSTKLEAVKLFNFYKLGVCMLFKVKHAKERYGSLKASDLFFVSLQVY